MIESICKIICDMQSVVTLVKHGKGKMHENTVKSAATKAVTE